VRQLATVRQESYPDWGGPAELIGISGCVYNIVGWAFYSVVREQGANEVFFLFCFVFLWGGNVLYSPGWPQTHNPPTSASSMPGLHVYITTPDLRFVCDGMGVWLK
jgi:hypothetical protein